MYLPLAIQSNPAAKQSYGVLWEGLKTKSPKQIFYNIVFIMRRFLVCFSYVFLMGFNYF